VPVTIRKRTSYSVNDFEVSRSPSCVCEPILHQLPDDSWVVGYLVRDEDPPHPLDDCDGMGKIYDRRQGSRTADRFWEHVADHFVKGWTYAEYGSVRLCHAPLAVPLDVYDHSGECWRLTGSGRFFPDERWDVTFVAGVWVPDQACLDHIRRTAAESLLGITLPCRHPRVEKDGTVLYPTFYGYTLPDGTSKSLRCTNPLNAARAAARRLKTRLDEEELTAKTREKAVTYAQQAVDEYNKWLAGDAWGVCVEVFDADKEYVSEDYCWGYLGSDFAKTVLEGEISATVSYYTQNPIGQEE